jgi:hypothetical protein
MPGGPALAFDLGTPGERFGVVGFDEYEERLREAARHGAEGVVSVVCLPDRLQLPLEILQGLRAVPPDGLPALVVGDLFDGPSHS